MDCRCACQQLPDDGYHVASYDVCTPDDHKIMWVFPREPCWWRDDDTEDRRQEVFAQFEPSDITILIDEVWMYVQSPPQTAEECAQLMRRLLSLSWMIEVCCGSLAHLSDDAELDHAVRYWQQRAARYLLHAAWSVVAGSSHEVLAVGIRDAARTCSEITASTEGE